MNHVQLDLLTDLNRPSSARACEIDPLELTREQIEVDLGLVTAQTWSPRHKVHKYWGRKPANVVSRYIEYFSRPAEIVLDPFCGSSVTVVEAAALGRKAIGYDFNPFAARFGGALLSPPEPSAFRAAAIAIIAAVTDEADAAFTTVCRVCAKPTVVRSYGYEGATLVTVRFRCHHCGTNAEVAPTEDDVSLSKATFTPPVGTPDGDIFFGWEMQKLKRGEARRWRDLFTSRNFAIAGRLWEEINKVEAGPVREWLLFTLTASLAQFTRMIADFSGGAGGPSWKINCYWLPNKWQELHPVRYFENRVHKSAAAIDDLISAGAPFIHACVQQNDSRNLPLEDESIDYIFTDPPYGGEGIQYGELTMLWNTWLGQQATLRDEIAFNPIRNLPQEHYDAGIASVFSELMRVLRPGRHMTVTFANKDPVVWDSLLSACRKAGFELVTAAPMKRSAPSLTETNMRLAPKADLILTFRKGERQRRNATSLEPDREDYSLSSRIDAIVAASQESGQSTSPQDVFDRITIDWFSWFYERGGRPANVQPTLDQVEKEMRRKGLYSPK